MHITVWFYYQRTLPYFLVMIFVMTIEKALQLRFYVAQLKKPFDWTNFAPINESKLHKSILFTIISCYFDITMSSAKIWE